MANILGTVFSYLLRKFLIFIACHQEADKKYIEHRSVLKRLHYHPRFSTGQALGPLEFQYGVEMTKNLVATVRKRS
jgi:hypothetical protein